MTDDPSKAFVTPGRNHPVMTTPSDTVTCEAVRVALIDLLTIGQHHHAATAASLTAVGNTRHALVNQHGTQDPTAHLAPDNRRLTALTQAMGAVSSALITVSQPRRPDATGLRDGLAELAAVALGWLDVLPDPNPDDQQF
jgi:uncharacterized protein YejL (UPF0352 family)